jgi:hypothetical protein
MREGKMPGDGDLFDRIWDLYIDPVKPRIRSRASEIAKADDRSEVTAIDVFEALKEFVPGKQIAQSPASASSQGWFNRTFAGFTGIAGIMALAFGVLGLVGIFSANASVSKATEGFLEIAKIFAGAMVGGAVGAAAVRRSN